jgi:hypothetical protein
MVSIRTVENARHYCGGVIITSRHIVSAAHCFKAYHHSKLKIYTGSSVSTSDQPNYRILEVDIHPKYTGILSRLSNSHNDIAIATVIRKLLFYYIYICMCVYIYIYIYIYCVLYLYISNNSCNLRTNFLIISLSK